MPQTRSIFDNIEVMRVTDFGFYGRIDGHEVFVGPTVPLRGTTVVRKGDVGRLVLPRWFVQLHGGLNGGRTRVRSAS